MNSLFHTCGRGKSTTLPYMSMGLCHSGFELISLFTRFCATACKQTENISTYFYMSVLTVSELEDFHIL